MPANQAVADADAVSDERLPGGGRAIPGSVFDGQTGESREELGDEARGQSYRAPASSSRPSERRLRVRE
jgi:hypothetical protein